MQEKSESTEQPKQLNVEVVKKGVSKVTLVIVIVVMLAIGYVLGTRNNEFAQYIPFLGTATGEELDLSSVQSTYNALKGKFDGELDQDKLIEGANKGLVEAAGDPYTTYFDAEEARAFSSDLEGTFSGIGAELGKREDKLTIITTLDDSPAKKSGLQADDVIARVNEEDATGWSVEKAVSKIRGEKGTTVKLTVVRGDSDVKDFTVTRDQITDESVKTEIKDGIGIMRISRFGDTDTVALARKTAQDFKDRNVKGIVVDLRGNGGGYLQASVDIASLWLDGDVVVSERQGDEVIEELRAGSNPILNGIPTVVLIDGGSASASEILAGALKDNDAATLVGTKTYGKGSVQQIINLAGGAQLKVTIAKWFTPAGKNIDKEGISPDEEVKYEGDSGDKDAQLDKALKLLNDS